LASEDDPGVLGGINRVIHDPSRLAICTALAHCESADFVFLRKVIGLTSGNLSFHLSRLEEAGLITLRRHLVGRATRTDVSLTPDGREQVARHWEALERLRTNSFDQPESSPRRPD